MITLTKLLKQNTNVCNEMLYHLSGQIIGWSSSAQSHILDDDITLTVNMYKARKLCTGPGSFNIHEHLPCPKLYNIDGHTAMTIGDVIGLHFSIGKDILFTK